MMGYRDPNDVDEEQEAAYWDMVLHDFGVDEYIRQRDAQHPPKRKDTAMEFRVSISGTYEQEVDVTSLEDEAAESIQRDLGQIDGLDVSAQDGTVVLTFDITGEVTVELDDYDLRTLVADKVESEFSTIRDLNIEEISDL